MITKYLFTLALLAGGLTLNAQTAKLATARIFESQFKEASRIILVYETGESEVIPLQNRKVFSSSSNNETLIENQKVINKLLNDMSEKGYKVSQLSNTIEPELPHYYTFIVFTKEE